MSTISRIIFFRETTLRDEACQRLLGIDLLKKYGYIVEIWDISFLVFPNLKADNSASEISERKFFLTKEDLYNALEKYKENDEVKYIEPALSARKPKVIFTDSGFQINVEVQNFGQVASEITPIKIIYFDDEKEIELTTGEVPPLQSFEKANVSLTTNKLFKKGETYNIRVILNSDENNPVIFDTTIEF